MLPFTDIALTKGVNRNMDIAMIASRGIAQVGVTAWIVLQQLCLQ